MEAHLRPWRQWRQLLRRVQARRVSQIPAAAAVLPAHQSSPSFFVQILTRSSLPKTNSDRCETDIFQYDADGDIELED